jgi:hypothetical protein
MRTYYDIRLSDRSITKRELEGEAVVKAGRYLMRRSGKPIHSLPSPASGPVSPSSCRRSHPSASIAAMPRIARRTFSAS